MAASHDSLNVEIDAPPEVRLEEPVPITVRVRNTSRAPIALNLLGRTIAFDIYVARSDGTSVWQRLRGASIPQILQVKTLAPAASFELRTVWDQRTDAGEAAGPGEYTVQARIPTDAQALETPRRSLRITARAPG